ncbi:MAG: peptidyl-prolyl cis-trans isomerase [Nitrospirota bacterium]
MRGQSTENYRTNMWNQQKAESRGKRGMGIFIIALVSVLGPFFFLFAGCGTVHERERVLAVVDGSPVTEGDLKYVLTISHRREDLSSAGALNLSHFIEKLIEDRLIINEARSSGMDRLPEIQKAIQDYILRESVVRLHDEEVVKKVTVTEEEISDYYKKNYEKFTIGMIEVKSEVEAGQILEELKGGTDFKELVKKYSTHPSKANEGIIDTPRISMQKPLQEVVSVLNPGQIADVIKLADKYYIIQLIERKDAPYDEYTRVKKSIESRLRKQREKDRSDEYLKYLREKADIKIDRELLDSIEPDIGQTGAEDNRPLVEVNGSMLTASEFMSMIKPSSRKSNEDIMNAWIERKLIDHEALSRHYEDDPDLKKMIRRYENQLLRNAFVKRIIVPQIVITEEKVKDYYIKNPEKFLKPRHHRVQQITTKTREKAEEILKKLNEGADFSWLAKMYSVDSAAPRGGEIGWVTKENLPKELRKSVDNMKPGDISAITEIDSSYSIIKLIEKTEEGVEEFDKVRDSVYEVCFDEELNGLLKKYVSELKEDSKIRKYDEEIRALEEKFEK